MEVLARATNVIVAIKKKIRSVLHVKGDTIIA